MASRWFEYLVPLIKATRSNVVRCEPLVTISGPSSVLTLAGHSLIIITPSSINVMGLRWLACVSHNAVLPACRPRAQVSWVASLENDA